MTMLVNSDSPKPISYEANYTPDGHREYTAIWQALSNDILDGPVEALATLGLPQVYPPLGPSIFEFGNSIDTGASVRSCRLRKTSTDDPSLTRHLLIYDYSSRSLDLDPTARYDDPLQAPVRWSGNFAQFTRVYDKTIFNLPIMNAAGDPFVDPPVEGDDSRPTIVAIKNYASLNLSLWRDYKDAVNSDVFLVYQPGEVKVSNISWDQRYHAFGSPASITKYFEVRFEFAVAANWKKEILNAGFRELVNPVAGDEPARIKGDDQLDVTSPWPLSTTGTALTKAQIDAGEANYITFTIYEELPFSALGLPSTIT